MFLGSNSTRKNDSGGSERIVYAIKNTRTRKWVYGTDFRHNPRTQRTSFEKAILFEDKEKADSEFKFRECGKDYKVVQVELVEVPE